MHPEVIFCTDFSRVLLDPLFCLKYHEEVKPPLSRVLVSCVCVRLYEFVPRWLITVIIHADQSLYNF